MNLNNSPIVSVIIPSYNAEDFIKETILSVLNQTYQNFEIIIIDDSSEDSTKTIIENLMNRDKRIILYTVPHIGNPSVLRNYGIKKSNGLFIAFLDNDDIWLKKKLEEQINLLNSQNSLSLVYSVSKSFGDVNILSPNFEILPLPFKAAYNRKDLLAKGNPVTCSTVITKKELLEKAGGFDETTGFLDDYDLWIRLSEYGPLGFVPQVHTLYRMHAKQASSTWKKKKDRLEEFSRQKNLNLPQYKFYRNKGMMFLLIRNIVHLVSYLYYLTIGRILFYRLINYK